MPYQTLGRLFGISHETSSTYYEELRDLFYKELVARLLYPLSADETKKITPEEFHSGRSSGYFGDLGCNGVQAQEQGGRVAFTCLVFSVPSPARRTGRVW